MGKAPVPGAVKSRLTPYLCQEQAALLHGAFLRDALLRALNVHGATVSLVHPAGLDGRLLAELLPEGVTDLAEHGADLGEAMCEAFRGLFSRGADIVVLTGADLPTLPASRIKEALAALESGGCDVVLGPAEDGGYYLIGLRAECPELFREIDWSTERVLAQTLAKVDASRLRLRLLDPWYDVDTPADVRRLIDELAIGSGLEAPTTRRVLASIATAGSASLVVR